MAAKKESKGRKGAAKARFLRFCFAKGICSKGSGGKVKGITNENKELMTKALRGNKTAQNRLDFKPKSRGVKEATSKVFKIQSQGSGKKNPVSRQQYQYMRDLGVKFTGFRSTTKEMEAISKYEASDIIDRAKRGERIEIVY